jgi:serine protease
VKRPDRHASLAGSVGPAVLAAVLLAAIPGCGGDAPPDAGIRVGGTIFAAEHSAVDGDVNDPAAPLRPNDSVGQAQPIPNPVSLGGYVNEPNTGEPGRSRVTGDVRDIYRTSLAMNQVVRLFVARGGLETDLGLRLLDASGNLVTSSDGGVRSEELTVPATDDYLIEVIALRGASAYVLAVGQPTTLSRLAASAPPPPEFVPGEIILRFREGQVGTMLAASPRAWAESLGLRRLRETRSDGVARLLLSCRDAPTRDETFRRLGIGHLLSRDPAILALDEEARLRRDTPLLVQALRRRHDVLSADLNYIRRPTRVPDDEFYDLQWHFSQINLPQAWDNVPDTPSPRPIVAVIDTGIRAGHPDLQGQLVPGYDFIKNPTSSLDGDGCDADPNDPGDAFIGVVSSWHGTHVAGTVAARTVFGSGKEALGVAGAAWNARVMPLRVLGRGGGTDADVMDALLYAAGATNGCNALPAERADVVNMSLGGGGYSAAFQAAVLTARAQGVTVVAAAGNDSSSTPIYPAAFDGVIAVAATDFERGRAPYSNFGTWVDVAAPGGDMSQDANGDGFGDGVLSTLFDPTNGHYVYGFYQGTSMAAPHVSAVIALMLSVKPDLGPADVDDMLRNGELTREIPGISLLGFGLIDAFKAVEAAFARDQSTPPNNAPFLRAFPDILDLGPFGASGNLEVLNVGGSDPPSLALAAPPSVSTDDGGSWISVAPSSVTADGLGNYVVSVDRSGLADGIYSGHIDFDSNYNDISVPVFMQVGVAISSDADAGHHFVLLVDPNTLETVTLTSVDVEGGVYRYELTDVAPGEYVIVAGSDLDNDFTICDEGEACGAYPTLDSAQTVSVSGSAGGFDFVTGFTTTLGPSSAAVDADAREGFSRSPAPR